MSQKSPEILFSESTDIEVRERVEQLAFDIGEDPEKYSAALDLIGEIGVIATGTTVQFLQTFPGGERALGQLTTFITEKDDLQSEFDPDTEAAIADNPKIVSLKNNRHIDPEERKNKIRLLRPKIFIDRKAAYNSHQTDIDPIEPSAA